MPEASNYIFEQKEPQPVAVTLKEKTAKELEIIALKCLALVLRCKGKKNLFDKQILS